MSQERTIAAIDLSAGFDKSVVLRQASVELSASQIIVIAGPNGAGKSTLVKTMARQLKPLGGRILLNGSDIWQMSAQQFAGQVAYVPQSIDIASELTVEEIVMLGRNPHQKWWQWYGSNDDSVAVNKALADTEMQQLRKKPLCQLSGGERQRAALATALAQEPTFMLLDEPTAHLDFKHQIELLALLKRLRLAGLGIMVVLHDLNIIARVADQVVLIEVGNGASKIGATGTVKQALSHDNLRRIFGIEVTTFDDPITGEVIYNPFSLAKNGLKIRD